MGRYVIVRDGLGESVVLWDGRSTYDPGPGASLVEESKFDGDFRPEPQPTGRTAEERIERLIDALKAVPEITDKVDLDAVKGEARGVIGGAVDVGLGR